MAQTVAEYFKDKHVFLTGATGFIGKVFVEKLLRTCPDIKGIFCLVRPKKGKYGHERLKSMFDEALYNKLRTEQPNFSDKIHVINGDILEENYGISEENLELIKEQTRIVIHSAATVRFDESLRLAVEMNLLAVRKLLKLCHEMRHIESLVHISTAYANCDRAFIEEMFYPPPMPYQRLIDAMEWMDDTMADAFTPRLLETCNKPNTYTLTKHLAEALLMAERGNLKVAVVRPSIVAAAFREPVPGWIDNWNGPSGLCIAAGKGILRSYKGHSDRVADIIPVDFPVNMTISAAWYTGVHQPEEVLFYQSTTGVLNPFTWGELEPIVIDFFKRNPLDSCFRRPKCQITSNSLLHEYWTLVSHLLPAYLTDVGYTLLGKKPRMVAIYKKLHKACSTLEYFTERQWEWTHDGMELLRQNLSESDRQTFYMDPRTLHWPTYIENYCMGTKLYVLKEDLSDLPAARAHLRMLRNIRYTFNTFVIVAVWRLLIANTKLARGLWLFIMNLVAKFVRFFRLTSTMTRTT